MQVKKKAFISYQKLFQHFKSKKVARTKKLSSNKKLRQPQKSFQIFLIKIFWEKNILMRNLFVLLTTSGNSLIKFTNLQVSLNQPILLILYLSFRIIGTHLTCLGKFYYKIGFHFFIWITQSMHGWFSILPPFYFSSIGYFDFLTFLFFSINLWMGDSLYFLPLYLVQ